MERKKDVFLLTFSKQVILNHKFRNNYDYVQNDCARFGRAFCGGAARLFLNPIFAELLSVRFLLSFAALYAITIIVRF